MQEQVTETWNVSNRINLYMLDALKDEHLSDVSASKGRTVGEQFAHLHNVRLMWLKASRPDLLEGLEKIEKGEATSRKRLAAALKGSSRAIERLLKDAMGSDGKVKGFKPHAVAFLGYMISHESHHRGQIALSLKQAGHALEKKVAYGIWEWGTR